LTGGWRERPAVLLVKGDPFLDRLAQFGVNLGLVIAVDATQHQPRTSADIAAVLF
jgi:hypothetical protein